MTILDQRKALPRFHVLQATRGWAHEVAFGSEHGTARLQRLCNRVDAFGRGTSAEGRRVTLGVRQQIAP